MKIKVYSFCSVLFTSQLVAATSSNQAFLYSDQGLQENNSSYSNFEETYLADIKNSM